MESESKVSLLPFFIGVTIIIVSAVSYLHFLKSPFTNPNPSLKVLSAQTSDVPPTSTPLPTPSVVPLKSVVISPSTFPNSNLISANAQIISLENLTEQECHKFDPANAISQIQKVTYQDTPAVFQESQTVIDTHISTTRQYRIFKDAKCLVITQNLQSQNMNAPHDSKIKELNYDLVWEKLTLPLSN